MAVREPDAAMMKAAAMEYGASGTEAATVKHRATAAAVEHCGATVKSTTATEASTAVKAATTVETTSATAMPTASAAMSAADHHRVHRRGLRSSVRRRRLSPPAQRLD